MECLGSEERTRLRMEREESHTQGMTLQWLQVERGGHFQAEQAWGTELGGTIAGSDSLFN
jgi:predicted N-acyltransferase